MSTLALRVVEDKERGNPVPRAITGTPCFFNSHSEGGVESKLGPLGTSATNWLLYLPKVIMRMENLVE
jgi:hypothetical protein